MTQPDRKSVKELAINTLSTIHEEDKRYNEANDIISKIEPDFPATILPMSGTCSTSVVTLLDAILDDGIASYFLYEAVGMKDGGKIIEEDGKEYPIRNIEDVRAYVFRSVA